MGIEKREKQTTETSIIGGLETNQPNTIISYDENGNLKYLTYEETAETVVSYVDPKVKFISISLTDVNNGYVIVNTSGVKNVGIARNGILIDSSLYIINSPNPGYISISNLSEGENIAISYLTI